MLSVLSNLQDIQPDITVPLPGFSTKKVSKKPHAFKIWHYSGKMKTYLLQFDDDDSMKKCINIYLAKYLLT